MNTVSIGNTVSISNTRFYVLNPVTSVTVGGTVSIANDIDTRLVTANGNSTLNGEANLTFDGTTLTVNGTQLRDFTIGDVDVAGLVKGSAFGSLIEGDANGHVVIGLRDNDVQDSFSVVSGNGDYYAYGDTYDKLAFQVKSNGTTTIGGSTTVSGSLNVTGDITAYHTSDQRLKDNITPIADALYKLNQIGGYEFDWNDNSEHSGHDVGVIAQEIEKVLPEVVVMRDNGYKAVRYEKIVALLIEAVKEQQSQIEELKKRL